MDTKKKYMSMQSTPSCVITIHEFEEIDFSIIQAFLRGPSMMHKK